MMRNLNGMLFVLGKAWLKHDLCIFNSLRVVILQSYTPHHHHHHHHQHHSLLSFGCVVSNSTGTKTNYKTNEITAYVVILYEEIDGKLREREGEREILSLVSRNKQQASQAKKFIIQSNGYRLRHNFGDHVHPMSINMYDIVLCIWSECVHTQQKCFNDIKNHINRKEQPATVVEVAQVHHVL